MATLCGKYCSEYRRHRISTGTRLYCERIQHRFHHTTRQQSNSRSDAEQDNADTTNADNMDARTVTTIGQGVISTIIAMVCLIPGIILTLYGEYHPGLALRLVGGAMTGVGMICTVISCTRCIVMNSSISREEYRMRTQANSRETAPPDNEEEARIIREGTNVFSPTSDVPPYHDVVRPDDVTPTYTIESEGDVGHQPPSYEDVVVSRT